MLKKLSLYPFKKYYVQFKGKIGRFWKFTVAMTAFVPYYLRVNMTFSSEKILVNWIYVVKRPWPPPVWYVCRIGTIADKELCVVISASLQLFWWITRRTKHTSHVTRFSKVLWFEENAEQAACHLSLHQKNPTGYQTRWGIDGMHGGFSYCVPVYRCMYVTFLECLDDMSSLRSVVWPCLAVVG